MRDCFVIPSLLSGSVTRSAKFFLTLDSYSQPLGSDFILHKYAASMCFNLPAPWLCSVAFASMAGTATQFLSTQTLQMMPPAALPLHCFLQGYVACACMLFFGVWLQSSITPALDDVRVSLQPAQSESENVVTSSTMLPSLNMCPILCRVSNIRPASSTWQSSVAWSSTSCDMTHSQGI